MINRFVIAILLIAVSIEVAGQEPKNRSARTDLYGDRLPEKAVLRFGTVRYRHPGWYKSIEFLPGKNQFVVNTKDNGPRIWDAATGKLIREIPRAGGQSVAFRVHRSLNAQVTLSSDIDGVTRTCETQLTIRQPGKGKHLSWTEPFTEHSIQFVLTPDGETVLTGTYDGAVKVVDVKTGKVTRAISITRGQIQAMDISPDGKTLAVAGRREAFLLNWKEDEAPTALMGITRVQVMRFSSDGSRVAIGSDDKFAATLWNTKTGKKIRTFKGAGQHYYREGLCFSPDHSKLYVPNSRLKSIEVFDVQNGNLAESLDAGVEARTVAVSDDGQFLATGGGNTKVIVWNLKTGERVSDQFVGHSEYTSVLAFTNKGTQVTSADFLGEIWIWNTSNAKPIQTFRHDGRVLAMAVSPNDQQLLSLGLDDTLRIRDMNSGEELHRLKGNGRGGGVQTCAVAYTHDGEQCLSIGSDLKLRRFDSESGKRVDEFTIKPTGIEELQSDEGPLYRGMQFNSDQSRLLITFPNRYYVFDTKTGKEIRVVNFEESVHRSRLSPTRSLLAIVAGQTDEFEIQMRDFSSNDVLWKLPATFAHRLRFSRDGRLIALANSERRRRRTASSIRVYDVRTGTSVATIPAGKSPIRELAFSPNADRIVSGHTDSTILLWNLSDFKK